MIRGEGAADIPGVSAQEVFDFVLDPAQYTKADTKLVWVTKLADLPDGMIAREDGKYFGRFPGSVVTRYQWAAPHRIDVRLEHGIPAALHAWFDIEEHGHFTRVHHVETLEMPKPFGWIWDVLTRRWFANSVRREVAEIARLMCAGERGRSRANEPPKG